MRLNLYLAGPRSDIKDWNTPAFVAAAADLRRRGRDVVSPVELAGIDEYMIGPMEPVPDDVYWRGLAPCINVVATANIDGAVVLPGWQRSRGVRLETFILFLRGKPILHYPTLNPVRRTTLVRAWLGEWAYLLAKVRLK